MADVLDVSVGFLRREVLRLARQEHIRTVGRRKLYKARPLLEAFLNRQLAGEREIDDIGICSGLGDADPDEWRK
ncbi:hypothetical protein [Posidoniimonas corsicana]|uniref:hypothetical protein n=1 Tax=Posidoniimonas corsicana TaxID=1938618 RepID=UPI0011B61AE9|nr:hypothetical protein [Posidoniimonas corsicana]